MVYDFDGRKLLKDITGNANHFDTKVEAEVFIKGELSKVLLANNGTKAKEVIASMNTKLKTSLGILDGDEAELTKSIVKVVGKTDGAFYSFIKVY
jgi:hypothetical protein